MKPNETTLPIEPSALSAVVPPIKMHILGVDADLSRYLALRAGDVAQSFSERTKFGA